MRIAVIIPAGPRDDILDTLASVVQYTDPSRVIVVIDDTGTLAARSAQIRELSGDIVVIAAPPGAPGVLGGLWVKVAAGYTWVLEQVPARVILRMDADALMLGSGIEAAAERALAREPGIGMLGSCRTGSGRRIPGTSRRPPGSSAPRKASTGLSTRDAGHSSGITRGWPGATATSPASTRSGRRTFTATRPRTDLYRNGWFREPRLAPSKPGRRPSDGPADRRGRLPDR